MWNVSFSTKKTKKQKYICVSFQRNYHINFAKKQIFLKQTDLHTEYSVKTRYKFSLTTKPPEGNLQQISLNKNIQKSPLPNNADF